MEERYADARDGPGAVATGGGEWKEPVNGSAVTTSQKRGRSPEDDDNEQRSVSDTLARCVQHVSDILDYSKGSTNET